MFSLRRPSDESMREALAAARGLSTSYGAALGTEGGFATLRVPDGFVRDHTRSEIGRGVKDFESAKTAFRQWKQFDLGWVCIANPETRIEAGELVAMEARTVGLWTLSFSRILYTIDEPNRFGFGYGTTTMHVERGEERFLLEYDPVTGTVSYELLAVSQPAYWMVRIGYLYARSLQRKFARESHARMREAVADWV